MIEYAPRMPSERGKKNNIEIYYLRQFKKEQIKSSQKKKKRKRKLKIEEEK